MSQQGDRLAALSRVTEAAFQVDQQKLAALRSEITKLQQVLLALSTQLLPIEAAPLSQLERRQEWLIQHRLKLLEQLDHLRSKEQELHAELRRSFGRANIAERLRHREREKAKKNGLAKNSSP